MRVISDEVRNKFAELWVDLDIVILVDSDFIFPKVDEVIKIFNESKVHEMQFVSQFNDCDNFALFFLAEVRKKLYDQYMNNELESDQLFPWAMGIAICTMTRGMDTTHAVNIVVCEEGIYIFDKTPDSNRFWKASKEMDNPIIVYM